MKLKLNDKEILNILEMHSKMKKNNIIEQSSQPQTNLSIDKQLQEKLTNGCITFGKVVKMGNPTKPERSFAIKQESAKTPGKFRYLFIDKAAYLFENGKFTKLPVNWDCPTKSEETKLPEKLNADQLKVLDLIKPLGWFNNPKPTNVEVEQGIYTSMDLSDPNSELGKIYSKYFPKEKVKEFLVYKKNIQNQLTQPQQPGRAERVEVTAESCKISIESLYSHMRSPNTYPLQNDAIKNYVSTAQKCAEPANRRIFLIRFGLNKKLNAIASNYGINIR